MQVSNTVALVALNPFSHIFVVLVDDLDALLVRHIALCSECSCELLQEHHELMRFHIVKLTIFDLLIQRLDVNMRVVLFIVASLIGVTPWLLGRHVTIAVFIIFRGR